MTVRETRATVGERRSRLLRTKLAEELVVGRVGAGISQRELARTIGVSQMRIARAEAAEPASLTIDLVARMAAVLGHQLAASLYPDGDPLRDRAHLELLARLRARLAPSLRWRAEVPIPLAGDRRSGDATIAGGGWTALVEAETRLGDLQHVERRAPAKQRDLGADRLILLVSDTRHNRSVLRLYPELSERFPIEARTCLRALASGQDPGGDAIVML